MSSRRSGKLMPRSRLYVLLHACGHRLMNGPIGSLCLLLGSVSWAHQLYELCLWHITSRSVDQSCLAAALATLLLCDGRLTCPSLLAPLPSITLHCPCDVCLSVYLRMHVRLQSMEPSVRAHRVRRWEAAVQRSFGWAGTHAETPSKRPLMIGVSIAVLGVAALLSTKWKRT